MDYGEEGFAETLLQLESLGIPYFGAGTLADNCNNPHIATVGETKVGLMGYVCPSTHPIFASETANGVVPIDLVRIARDIRTAIDRGAQRLVICLHWGDEEVWLPRPGDIAIANDILALGVDIVVGHHAHCRQPVMKKVKQGKAQYVFFGLGNAIFPDFEYRHHDGQISWKRQRSWNRTSTWVSYNSKEAVVHSETYKECNGQLVKAGLFTSAIENWILPNNFHESPSYARRFRTAQQMATMRNVLSRFASKPKFPSLQSLRYVFNSLIGGR